MHWDTWGQFEMYGIHVDVDECDEIHINEKFFLTESIFAKYIT